MSIDTATKPDFNAAAFDPTEYNNTYYSEVMQDEAALIAWQATELDLTVTQHLKDRGITRFTHQLEAGSGPAVHHLFALERYSDAIDLTDFLPGNLKEIRKWVDRDPDAHNWRPFVSQILKKEGITPSEDAICAREEAVRSKIRSYRPLDLKDPTDEMSAYRAPFVTSFFVADSATAEKDTFREMTGNAFGMVEPGGLFVGAYLGECEQYMVGDQWVNSANLSQRDIEETFAAIAALDVQVTRFDTPEMAHEGFDHIFTVTATAKA